MGDKNDPSGKVDGSEPIGEGNRDLLKSDIAVDPLGAIEVDGSGENLTEIELAGILKILQVRAGDRGSSAGGLKKQLADCKGGELSVVFDARDTIGRFAFPGESESEASMPEATVPAAASIQSDPNIPIRWWGKLLSKVLALCRCNCLRVGVRKIDDH
jgi:hypothetical protein